MLQSGSVLSSADLLARAKTGDDEALNSLVAAYLPRMRRWAQGRLPGRARDLVDTDDVIQETLMAALRNLDHVEVRGEGALQAYLRRALANRLIDLHRRHLRQPAAALIGSDLPALGPSPLEEAIGTETLARYECALGRLSPGDRELVILRIEMGCGYDEIAASTGKSSQAHARMAVSRAIARLAREMRYGQR
jgi:RNA polymerase sigma-70 factor, ECF subfamily